MSVKISGEKYAMMYGPTTGDKVRLADTDIIIEVEKDYTTYGDEIKFGGGKTIRDGMGQSVKTKSADGDLDLVITNALILDYTGIVKADIDIKKPILEMSFDANLHKANYVYIESMNRYYYITDKQNVTGNRFRVYCDVDVLESFKDDILKEQVILASTEKIGSNNYLPSTVWKSTVKDKTEIKTFPSGLLENGEWVLITAGG